jgi:AraC-like DNA-binding protein
MIKTPDGLIETPELTEARRIRLLSDVLSRIRLSGAIFLRGEYSAPWAFDSPEAPDLVNLLAPDASRLVLFHVVREGRAWVSARGELIDLEPGDLAVLPHADRHVMGSRPERTDPVPIADLLPPLPWQGVPVCSFAGGGENTGVVCGYLRCDELLFNSFMRQLPAVLRVRPPVGASSELIRACVNYALDERSHPRTGGAPLATRMPEMLLIEALRIYSEDSTSDKGWLAAISDPVVGRALSLLHSEPTFRWTVGELASRAATSRSVLDERFRRFLGGPPMRYLTEWRLQLAADLMKDTTAKLADIAQSVGYGSEEAFSRAFHRYLGASPGHWRVTHRLNGM